MAANAGIATAPAGTDRPRQRDPVLHGVELVVGLGALGLVSFVGILDLTIVNVILPSIASTFSASPHEVTMGITCFAAAQAVATPVTGWLATRYGVIRVFILSLIAFAVASFLCGIAPSLGAFVIARVLQGAAAGPLLPVVQTLLQRSVPKPLLPAALAFWAVVISAAPMVGPIVGGGMADSIGWSWGFYINIPFVIIAIVIVWRIFGNRETPKVDVPLDYVGLGLLVTWVAALQFALDKGADLDWFSSPLVVALLVTAAVGFIAFMIWEFTDEHPLIDFSVFRYRSFLIGTPVSTISYSSMALTSLLLTLWLQFGMGYNATWAGYAVAVMGASSLVAGPLAAFLGRRVDQRLIISVFMTMTAVGLLWRSTFYGAVDFSTIMIAQLLLGLTTTAAMGPIFAMVMSDIPPAKLPGAAGLLTFVRMLFFAVVTATMTTSWTYGQSRAHSDMAASLNMDARPLDPFQTGDGMTRAALTMWNDLINREAITLSTQTTLVWLALGVLIAPILIWFCPKPRSTRER